MAKRIAVALSLIIGTALIVYGAVFYYRNLRGAGPAIKPPPRDIGNTVDNVPQNTTGFPLKLPPGFSISIFAKDLPGVRVIAQDARGNVWVSRTSEGIITMLQIDDGKVISQQDVFKNLKKPHGLAFDPKNPTMLYIAQEDSISRTYVFIDGEPVLEKIVDLPKAGRHFTRTLQFGSDGRLYVSIGSTCDVCHEKDERYAAVYSMNTDGTDFKQVAKGLRNSVFMTLHPTSGKIWATEMGRDGLGDNLPPDEINVIQGPSVDSGQNSAIPNFGWPNCYGKNIHDDAFDKNVYIRNPCMEPFETPSFIDLPAHSAPLGLAFVPSNSAWPEEYWNNLLVAYHGSWNRTEPTGYKIVRFRLDENSRYAGVAATTEPQPEDFITGWLAKGGALGRPVDILVQPGGVMYVSDDKAGVIYKVQYGGKKAEPQTQALKYKDLIEIDNLQKDQTISSPMTITGRARGTWYFEASFPVTLRGAEGQTIAQTHATAEGDWMTEDYVPFTVTITFDKPTSGTGMLIFEKDNPSGLPEHADEFRVPVNF